MRGRVEGELETRKEWLCNFTDFLYSCYFCELKPKVLYQATIDLLEMIGLNQLDLSDHSLPSYFRPWKEKRCCMIKHSWLSNRFPYKRRFCPTCSFPKSGAIVLR